MILPSMYRVPFIGLLGEMYRVPFIGTLHRFVRRVTRRCGMLAGCVRSCMEWIPLKWSGVPQPQPIGLATWVLLSVTRTVAAFAFLGGRF